MTHLNIKDFKGIILDLEGVLTRTATIHAKAWKQLFDEYFESLYQGNIKPFNIDKDYPFYLDGKPRYEGVQSLLKSRGLELPYGEPEDSIDQQTIYGLGNRKNQIFQDLLEEEGVRVYEDAVTQLMKWRNLGLKTAIISSSKNCRFILEVSGLINLTHIVIDGKTAEEQALKGKPEPAILLEAAEALNLAPKECIIFEDAISGIKAGKNGNFGLVVGIARYQNQQHLKNANADMVLPNFRGMDHLQNTQMQPWSRNHISSALNQFKTIAFELKKYQPVFFFDYDGTLTTIVSNPSEAKIDNRTKGLVQALSSHYYVGILSGRDLTDVQQLVGIDNIYYAGSHGFEIAGPGGLHQSYENNRELLPELDRIEHLLRDQIQTKDAWIERKRYAIAIHYRHVAKEDVHSLKKTIHEIAIGSTQLKLAHGKEVFEFKPNIEWHKGKAMNWLMEELGLNQAIYLPLYLGDDITDEDALFEIAGNGVGILVGDHGSETYAGYKLEDVTEVQQFLNLILEIT